jgi:hypothetical protein
MAAAFEPCPAAPQRRKGVHPLHVHSGTLALVGMPSYGTLGMVLGSQ